MSREKKYALAENIAATLVVFSGAAAGMLWLLGAATHREAAPVVFISLAFDFFQKKLACKKY